MIFLRFPFKTRCASQEARRFFVRHAEPDTLLTNRYGKAADFSAISELHTKRAIPNSARSPEWLFSLEYFFRSLIT